MLLDSDGKAAAIRDVADFFPDYDAFVETGTALGDLPYRLVDRFERLVTIERADDYYASAVNRLLAFPTIRVLHGDSSALLAPVLCALDEPCVIWLDAHEIVRGGSAAMKAEMDAIARDPLKHVILIDDARLCNGRKGWMTLGGINDWARTHGYNCADVVDDIVRLTP